MSTDPSQLGGTIGPGQSYGDGSTTTATTSTDWQTAVLQALIARGIDPFSMDPTQLQTVIEALANDQYLSDLLNVEQGNVNGFNVSVSMSELQSAIERTLFEPTQSDNSQILGIGLGLLQSQNVPLSGSQQNFIATGQQGGSSSYGSQGYLADLARQAGFPESVIPTVVAIAMAESGGNPAAEGDMNATTNFEGSWGLMQINRYAHPDLAAKYDLTDPLQNMKAAYQIWTNAGQAFGDWSTYNSGAYTQYLGAGQGPYVTAPGGGSTLASLEQQYSPLYREFVAQYGRQPTLNEMQGLIGMTPDQYRAELRTQPSHIPGMTNGAYQDLKATADSQSQSLFGHGVTDGMVQELNQQGLLGPGQVKLWLINQDIEGKMDPKTYQSIWQASAPHLQAVYNEPGFDPRHAVQIHQKMQQQGLTVGEAGDLPRAWSDYRRQLADYGDPDVSAEQRDVQKTIDDTAAGVF